MAQMIHMVLGISGYFTFGCCLMAGWTLFDSWEVLWNQERQTLWLFIFLAVLCMLGAAAGMKNKRVPRWLMADSFCSWVWCYFYVYQAPWGGLVQRDVYGSITLMIYAVLCYVVFFADSTERLSPTKVAIAATFFTPLVVLGLLIYNNKNIVDEVEKNLLRAQRAIEDGGYDVAITSATKAIEICPVNTEETYYLSKCYYLRGKAYRYAGEFQKAKEDLWEAEDLAGKRKDKSFLASVKLEQSNNEIANNIDDGYAYQQRGEAYMNRMEANPEEDFTDVAIADFNKAIELDDQEAYAFAQRGLLYAEKKGDYAQAIADCTKAIEIASAKDYANWVIALAYRTRRKVYLKMGDKEKAEADYATAHQLEENMSEQESALRAARLGRI